MAESNLSIEFTDLKSEVGVFLGYGRGGTAFADWAAMDPNPEAEVESVVQSGYRRVLYPPAVEGVKPGHEWSFLRPTATLYLGANAADGVIGADTPGDKVLTSATYANWETIGITTDDTVTITDSTDDEATTGEYAITSVTGGNITLTTDPGDAAGITFFVNRTPANYDLPDDFHRMIGDLMHASDSYRPAIKIVSEQEILNMRARGTFTNAPVYAATRFKAGTYTDGQRQEILFYPTPDTGYVLFANYEAYSGKLTATLKYPLGGMHLAELYIESCLAVAEQRINEQVGLHTQQYHMLLADAILRDSKKGAQIFGQMGHIDPYDKALYPYSPFRRGYTGASYPISYRGVDI
jgi:hypothetical protein